MTTTISLAYLVAAVLFIVGIKLLGSPKSARRGNLVAAAGMLIALAAAITQLHGPDGGAVPSLNWILIAVATGIGLGVGAYGAYSVKMTAMPQMVALFNGLGGGAAV